MVYAVACVVDFNKNVLLMEIIGEMRDLPWLGNDVIHVWGLHVPDLLDRIEPLGRILCDREREKAARYHRESDRQASIVSRGALRILLSGYSGEPAAQINFEYTENGKPHMLDSELAFNVSHSGEWVVLAIGRDRKIGVDVEMIRRDMDVLAIASRYFTPEEIARIETAEDRHSVFFQLWARKEAYVKACGSTLFSELAHFSVPMEEGGENDGWIFQRLEAGSEYAAAIVTDKKLA
ncbi:MAG: 4'-phosphopantetheinyl transferase superfamily protein, partial [Kiritimatiellales bacterium]|nr:4'-phosphopantetheinyl transferase superfamily protein [Kiritimatiellales bacterium]